MSQQLILDVHLNDESTLSNFNWLGNEVLQQQIEECLEKTSVEHILYLWGAHAYGKSHILQACCHRKQQSNAIYLPLLQFKQYGPDCIAGLESHDLICLDDIDAIAGDREWEEALFHFYNKIKDNHHSTLIISGGCSSTTLPIELPDLRSRLSWGLVFQINELCDAGKITTLQSHARSKGFELTDSTCQYLITHYSRSMVDLLAHLSTLDHASLAAKRKITIPFIKSTLSH